MRTIKFRGQTVDTKELIYGDLIQTEKDFKNVVEILDWSKVGCKPKKSLVVNPETVGQFTGLTDKNGVEIYEGDFLEGFKYPVTFEDGCFCATIQYDLVRCWLNSENCNLENLEVIGNVHDNPELLQ